MFVISFCASFDLFSRPLLCRHPLVKNPCYKGLNEYAKSHTRVLILSEDVTATSTGDNLLQKKIKLTFTFTTIWRQLRDVISIVSCSSRTSEMHQWPILRWSGYRSGYRVKKLSCMTAAGLSASARAGPIQNLIDHTPCVCRNVNTQHAL